MTPDVNAPDVNAPDPTVRLPYWLSAVARADLLHDCKEALTAGHVPDHDIGFLREVLIELTVAGPRDAAWPAAGKAIRKAAGWSDDVLPVRMSTPEHRAVLRYVTNPHLRQSLEGPVGA